MTKLYTVESFSTYAGIILSESKDFFCISLQDGNVEDNLIYINEEKFNKPKIVVKKLGMVRRKMAISGFLEKVQDMLTLSKPKTQFGGKIIFSRCKEFKIIKGHAEFVIPPKKEHDFTLIRISKYTTIELVVPINANFFQKKRISYRDLKT